MSLWLTADEVVAACAEGGYRVLAQHETVIVADRPLLGGHKGDLRSLVFLRAAPADPRWFASCHVRRLTNPVAPVTYDTRCVTKSGPLEDDLALRIWIGGAGSIPADRRETQELVKA